MKLNKYITIGIVFCSLLATVLMIIGFVNHFGSAIALNDLRANLFDMQTARTVFGDIYTGFGQGLDLALAGFAFFMVALALLVTRIFMAFKAISGGNRAF